MQGWEEYLPLSVEGGIALNPREIWKLKSIYDSSGGLQDFSRIRSLLQNTCGQVLNDNDLNDVIRNSLYQLGHCMTLQEFLKIMNSLKHKYNRETQTNTTTEAFIALGGDCTTRGEVSTERLIQTIEEFELSLEIGKLIQDVDSKKTGFMGYNEFASIFESKDVEEKELHVVQEPALLLSAKRQSLQSHKPRKSSARTFTVAAMKRMDEMSTRRSRVRRDVPTLSVLGSGPSKRQLSFLCETPSQLGRNSDAGDLTHRSDQRRASSLRWRAPSTDGMCQRHRSLGSFAAEIDKLSDHSQRASRAVEDDLPPSRRESSDCVRCNSVALKADGINGMTSQQSIEDSQFCVDGIQRIVSESFSTPTGCRPLTPTHEKTVVNDNIAIRSKTVSSPFRSYSPRRNDVSKTALTFLQRLGVDIEKKNRWHRVVAIRNKRKRRWDTCVTLPHKWPTACIGPIRSEMRPRPTSCLPRQEKALPLLAIQPRPQTSQRRGEDYLKKWGQGGVLRGNPVTTTCEKRKLPAAGWQ